MIIGIDVGGTHTDGVLLQNGQVMATTKVLTERTELTGSLLKALDQLLAKQNVAQIQRIVFSTTLTTNLITQKKYPPTGLVVMPGPGVCPANLAIGSANWLLSGSIDHRGRQVANLNQSEVQNMLDELQHSGIKDLAVVSKFSSRNPVLEEDIFAEIRAKVPAVDNIQLGYQVAPGLNFPRRVQTCFLNTAVQREYSNFFHAVQAAVRARGVTARLFLLKADGGTMPLADGLRFGVETVKSGPAAGIMGFLAFSGRGREQQTTLLLDIGGTTTDIALLANGVPLFEPEGVQIGGYLTAVRGLLSRSIALGGDSAVVMENGKPVLLSERRGPAITFGGTQPTLTDALVILGKFTGNQPEKVREFFPTWHGTSASEDVEADSAAPQTTQIIGGISPQPGQVRVARAILNQFLNQVREVYENLLREINSQPVYTIHELLQGTTVRPETMLVVGGPAPALLQELSRELGLPASLPDYHHVTNALGAAVARPTMAHALYADTAQKFYTLTGLKGKQPIKGRFSVNDARHLLLSHLEQQVNAMGDSTDSGTEESAHWEVTHEESFNIVRGFSTQGQIFKLEAQVKPGIEWVIDATSPLAPSADSCSPTTEGGATDER